MGRSEMNLSDSDVPETVESDLPTSTVTFLLTDIEGSTKLWEAGADATALSVARHYELLDAAVSLHAGVRPVEQGRDECSRSRWPEASSVPRHSHSTGPKPRTFR